MLYYTSLFLIIVLVSIITIWMYRAILGVGRATHNAVLPGRGKVSSKAKARLKTRRKAQAKADSVYSEVPTPWGWKDSANSVQKPGSDKVLWSGSNKEHGVKETYVGYSQSSGHVPGFGQPVAGSPAKRVGWPYREDKLAFAGKAYKVNRRPVDHDDPTSEGKPWVW